MNNKEFRFENRVDAGRKLAAELLKDYDREPVTVLAIPNGGVPVAFEIASALSKADLSLIITRKIPVPLSPEAGLGAIADDGTIFLDEEMMARFNLSRQQIEPEINRVRAELKKRNIQYYKEKPLASIVNKTVILVDDGIAAGFTMRAAVESVRHRRPKKVIVAVPAAAGNALRKVENVADRVVTCAVGEGPKFYIADFYRQWYDVNDDEVMRYLEKWQAKKFHRN